MASDAPPWIAALKLCSQAITEYGLQKQWQSAVGLLAAVREEGIPPDLTLYRKTLNACRESGRWRECMHALRYLRHVQRQGLRAGAVLYGATMASASGLESSTSGVSFTVQWHRAVHVLHGMREDDAKTDAASWRIVISATGQAAHWTCAAQMLSEMRRESLDTGAEAYTGVMLAALNRDVWPAVLSLFRDLRREGGALSTAMFTAITAAVAKRGGKPHWCTGAGFQSTQFARAGRPGSMRSFGAPQAATTIRRPPLTTSGGPWRKGRGGASGSTAASIAETSSTPWQPSNQVFACRSTTVTKGEAHATMTMLQ
ncbi:unnamed protein product [Effrenium voratum]|nr:unnamed protein product [Effrenium voratum]